MAYFEISLDDKNKVLTNYNKTHESIEEDIRIIREWYKSQKHLPKSLLNKYDNYIHLLLRINNYSIEITKQKLDLLNRLKVVALNDFLKINYTWDEIADFSRYYSIVPLPKLTKDGKRVIIMRLNQKEIDLFDYGKLEVLIMYFIMWRAVVDFIWDDVFVIDAKFVAFAHVSKVNFTRVKLIIAFGEHFMENMNFKMHYINCSPATDAFLLIFKPILQSSIVNNLFTYQSDDVLLKLFPKEILPCDYGGDERSLEELQGEVISNIRNYKDDIKTDIEIRENSSLRLKPPNDDFLAGVQGNFKKLDVD